MVFKKVDCETNHLNRDCEASRGEAVAISKEIASYLL